MKFEGEVWGWLAPPLEIVPKLTANRTVKRPMTDWPRGVRCSTHTHTHTRSRSRASDLSTRVLFAGYAVRHLRFPLYLPLVSWILCTSNITIFDIEIFDAVDRKITHN